MLTRAQQKMLFTSLARRSEGKEGRLLQLCFLSLISVLGIRIRMFLGLQDPDPDLSVKGTDPAPDTSLSEIMLAKWDFYAKF